ncbi:uncharacterized protein A4U43_C07F3700 [Asparagus officinalis]|uniref:Dof-type domain-containing protein n=1 Tax=Asparagus officinalis TaxID=4686 RepID=A0A5P1E996_ASPOF|nr:uncharacterized protein LOC109846660 [Asparagus officinalis]ONK62422.1 uncharacterized protein A4U43_C07F3700 [Asparagus officinalis]
MPSLRLNQHQVLLLQQLQPVPAPLLLQGLPCRKNKRSSSSSKKPESTPQALTASSSMTSNPLLSYAAPSHDLTLAPLLLGPNPNPNPNFLDILRSGFLDSANPEGFSNLCSYGFDGGLGLSSTATTTTTTAVSETGDHDNKMMMMGHQWQLNDANNGNVGVDSARDYWSGGGGYNWQGIINSSLM